MRSAARVSLATLAAAMVCGLAQPCLALILIKDASPDQAKELGIAVRPVRRENDVRVLVDFKTTGALKNFRYANLALTQGEKTLVSAALMPRKPTRDSGPENVQLEFYVDPEALPNASVTVIGYPEPLTGIGYRLKMKDFPVAPASR
jgi:hypothetical protein